MNETMARSLPLQELAEEFRYADDPGVRTMAIGVIEDGIAEKDYDAEAAGLQSEVDLANDRAETAEQEVKDLKELLRECLAELPRTDETADLFDRIKAST